MKNCTPRAWRGNRLTAWLALLLALSLLGCQAEPLPVPPPPPPPPPATAAPSAPVASTVAPPSTAVAPEARTQPASPTAAATEFTVATDEAVVSFPDRIIFSLEGTSPATVKSVSLRYGSDKRALAPETTTSKPEFAESSRVSVKWPWEMKKTGSLPPGATVWWQWEITDASGKATTTPRKAISYSDSRFQWRSNSLADMEVYWHDQDESLINDLLSALRSRLSRVQLYVSIPAERSPKVFIYRSSAELRDAVLFEHQWTGALAYPEYNIILTAVSSSSLEWAKATLPHEITHLLVGEAVFGPFGGIPKWLSEGLAEYASGTVLSHAQRSLDSAVAAGKLISVRSLSSSFPADDAGATLAYAESASIVAFVVDKYGWDKMRQLLATFKDGASYDGALTKVYSFDTGGLEAQWKAYIGAR